MTDELLKFWGRPVVVLKIFVKAVKVQWVNHKRVKTQEDNILEKIHSLKFWSLNSLAHNGSKLNDPLKSSNFDDFSTV